MRLTLNRIVALAAIAAAGLMAGCSADSPGPTGTPGPGPGPNGLAITVQANPTNPIQGNCSLVTVNATQNGAPVPAGTSVTLSSTFGAFAQNGLQTISLVTNNGVATTAVCSNTAGPATVTGKVTVGTKSATGSTVVNFQPNGVPTGPFISICSSPHTGPVSGGTPITISGGGFGTNTANVRVFFRSGGVVHQGVITSLTDSTINVTTPAFPELAGLPATPVEVDVLLNGQTLASPGCFTYTSDNQPIVTAILPASGTKIGGTRVSIIGSGFSAPVQVFFGGTLEAQVVSVSPTEIVVITPPANAQGPDTAFPQNVDVTVKEVNCSGVTCTSSPVTYTYTVGMSIYGFTPDHGDSSTTVTITGQGFVAPLIVTFGPDQGTVLSVTGTQILAKPPAVCPGSSGVITVTLLSNGETASSSSAFKINVPAVTSGPSPSSGPGSTGTAAVVTGTNLFTQGSTSPGAVTPSATGGNVTVTSISEVNGQQTVNLLITPSECTDVQFKLINSASGCLTGTLNFTNTTKGTPPVASFTQSNGDSTSHQVTFTSNSTVTNGPVSCLWTISGPITNSPNLTACTVSVEFGCGASGPACAPAPTATLKATDACGNSNTSPPQTVSPP